jgi:hypothetical protein
MSKTVLLVIGLVVLCIAMTGCLTSTTCKYANTPEGELVVTETQANLVAMRNQQDVEGHIVGAIFIVGSMSGSISTEDYYSYYYYLPDGGMMRGKVSADRTTIYEENRTDGVLYSYSGRMCSCNTCHPAYTWEFKPYYKVHVPKGSVIREFKLE